MPTTQEMAQQQADISIFFGLVGFFFILSPLAIMFVRFVRHPTHGVSAMFTPLPQLSKRRPLASQVRSYLYAHSRWGWWLDFTQALFSGLSCLLYIVTSYAMTEFTWVTDVEVRSNGGGSGDGRG
jgi:hypothetical protein